MPRQLEWTALLRELAVQLEQGAIYDRHMIALAAAVDDVIRAIRRRAGLIRGVTKPRRARTWG